MTLRPTQPMSEWTVEDLFRLRPDAIRIFTRYRMACAGCAMARFETVAEAAREYRLNVSAFLKELRCEAGAAQGPVPVRVGARRLTDRGTRHLHRDLADDGHSRASEESP